MVGYQRERSAGSGGAPHFGFQKSDRRVTVYYFYIWDNEFGPGFIKICSYSTTRQKSGSTAISGPSNRPSWKALGSPSSPMALPFSTRVVTQDTQVRLNLT